MAAVGSPLMSSVTSLFGRRDFTLLYWLNICEFFASTLSRLSALQWLYEDTADGRALALLGAVTLVCQIPSIALGGVLADACNRAQLVARVQTAAAIVASLRYLLCVSAALTPGWIYLTVGLLEITSRLESSARSSMLASVVDEAALPHAVTIVQLTQFLGEILAPFLFWLLADTGSATALPDAVCASDANASCAAVRRLSEGGTTGLSWPFAAAALSFVPCAILPRLIATDTRPSSGGGSAGAGAASSETGGSSSALGTISRAWIAGLRSMVEGVRYICAHPLLPGLYALDWGFTCVSFYRELFPLWVGVWLTQGVPDGVSSRGAVALLVVANFAGGMGGTLSTFALNAYPYKGRLVVIAVAAYGVACFGFGCSQLLLVGASMIFLMGATDAVGATMRKQVVLLSTPDHLRGRAQSGHQMAAYLANSIGQMYVGFMVATIGAGLTMQIGGVVTELMTGFFAWRIPALLTYPKGVNDVASRTAAAGAAEPQADSNGLAAVPEASGRAGADDAWQLNDAARAAAELSRAEEVQEMEMQKQVEPSEKTSSDQ